MALSTSDSLEPVVKFPIMRALVTGFTRLFWEIPKMVSTPGVFSRVNIARSGLIAVKTLVFSVLAVDRKIGLKVVTKVDPRFPNRLIVARFALFQGTNFFATLSPISMIVLMARGTGRLCLRPIVVGFAFR